MSHLTTISLTDAEDQFIASQIQAGEYGSASEVMRAALRLLETEKQRVAALRQAIAEGDAAYVRGEVVTYNRPGELAAELKERLRR